MEQTKEVIVMATVAPSRAGGTDQWIHIRGSDPTNPIVLFLHGGPGTSQLTSNARNTRTLEDVLTLVDWDQRGAGKSYAAGRDRESMTIDRFVADTQELTVQLLQRLRQERLVLAGHSWGSVIGALTVAAYPELFSCYVGIGQVSNVADAEAISYQWTLDQARQRHDRRAVRALEREDELNARTTTAASTGAVRGVEVVTALHEHHHRHRQARDVLEEVHCDLTPRSATCSTTACARRCERSRWGANHRGLRRLTELSEGPRRGTR